MIIQPLTAPAIVRAPFADHTTYGTEPPRGCENFGFVEGMSLDAPEDIPAGSTRDWYSMPLITVFAR